jgi:translation initiation factor 2 gamma subunit (eIF-2gamma)
MSGLETLINIGAIPALIGVLNNHFDKPYVIQYAMSMFVDLSKHSVNTSNLLIAANLPDAIFKVINGNKTHKETLSKSCHIINNLIVTHPMILNQNRVDILRVVVNFIGVEPSADNDITEDPVLPIIVNED